jgi:6-phospho-beta-glucosidase
MKLTILGGGGFRVPLIYRALLDDQRQPRIDDVVLYDIDIDRLRAIAAVLAQQASAMPTGGFPAPAVRVTTDLCDAIADTDFVFSAIRVGGLAGRSRDEHIALNAGVLGQETTGPGGLAYGWRTIPVAQQIARAIDQLAPRAQVINFTNPAGMITEAMRAILGDRVIGICDSPIGLAYRAARALRIDPSRISPDYAGLNHLGWLRRLFYQGEDVLPQLLADPEALAEIEEVRLLGPDWVQSLRCLPNEYLYYFYFTREANGSIRASDQTRGDFLLKQQGSFYQTVAADPGHALTHWKTARQEREETYLADIRAADDSRQATDIAGGGYERVALDYMTAVMRGETTTMILNVANGSTLPGLPHDAVVEVPCLVNRNGARPLATDPLAGHQLGLVHQVKAVERLTIQAAREQNPGLMIKAFALHPLVDSVSVARDLARRYRITGTPAS